MLRALSEASLSLFRSPRAFFSLSLRLDLLTPRHTYTHTGRHAASNRRLSVHRFVFFLLLLGYVQEYRCSAEVLFRSRCIQEEIETADFISNLFPALAEDSIFMLLTMLQRIIADEQGVREIGLRLIIHDMRCGY